MRMLFGYAKKCAAIIIIWLLFSYCGRTKSSDVELKEADLIYNTSTFSAPVTCITKSQSPEVFYVGLNNGNIVIKDLYSDRQDLIALGNNRVYEIFEYNNLLLIGIRDEGLKIYDKSKKSIIDGYLLAGQELNEFKYSVYSITFDPTVNLFVIGTSNGFYTFDYNNSTKVLEKYPNTSFAQHHTVNKVLYHQKSKKVYIASDSTLVIGGGNLIDTIAGFGRTIYDLFTKDDDIYLCLKDSVVHKYDISSKEITRIHLKGKYHSFAKDNNGGEWLIGKYIIIYKNKNGEKVIQNIPQGVSLDGRNIVCVTDDFVIVASQNKLLFFATHQNIYGKSQNVVALCRDIVDDKLLFCLTEDGCLNSIKEKSGYEVYDYESSLVGKIDGLPMTSDIVSSCVTHNNFYWVATDKSLYKICISNQKVIRNIKLDRASNDIRCLFYDGSTKRLYIGTRYGLNYIDIERGDKVYSRTTDQNLYVTDICKHDDSLIVATLNRGLYKIPCDSSSTHIDIMMTDSITSQYGNILNIGMVESNLFIYTPSGIYKYVNPLEMESLHGDLIPLNRIRAIKVDNGNYNIIGYSGLDMVNVIDTYNVSAISFPDVYINNVAWIPLSDKVMIVGGPAGLMAYNNKIKQLQQIELERLKIHKPDIILFFKISLLIIILVIGYMLFIMKRKNGNQKKQIVALEKQAIVQNERIISFENSLSSHLKIVPEKIGLDARDLRFIQLLAEGKTISEITTDKEIGVAEERLHQIQSNIASKLEVENRRVPIVCKAIKDGIVDIKTLEIRPKNK